MEECKTCTDSKKFAEFLIEEYGEEIAERMLGIKTMLELGVLNEDETIKRLQGLEKSTQKSETSGLGIINAVIDNTRLFRQKRPRLLRILE